MSSPDRHTYGPTPEQLRARYATKLEIPPFRPRSRQQTSDTRAQVAQLISHLTASVAPQQTPSRKRKRGDETPSDDNHDVDYQPTGLPSESESESGELEMIMKTYPSRKRARSGVTSEPQNIQAAALEASVDPVGTAPSPSAFQRSRAPSPSRGIMESTPVVGPGSQWPRLNEVDLEAANILLNFSRQAWAQSASGQDRNVEVLEKEVEERRRNELV